MRQPEYYSRFAQTIVTHGGNLPHWSQQCATFVTFRLADSLPQDVLSSYVEDRTAWLNTHPKPWDDITAEEYRHRFPKRLHTWLDAGYGSCILKSAPERKIVEQALVHYADVRYSLYGYVVMPNHVHILFMPEKGFESAKIVSDWKRYTARMLNAKLGTTGSIWQKESYDHLVRDAREFEHFRHYIRSNSPSLAFDAYATDDDMSFA